MHVYDQGIRVRSIHSSTEFAQLDSLYQHSFGAASVPTEVLLSWWALSPQGLLGLFKKNEVIGGIAVWPISATCYGELLAGHLREREIKATDLDLIQRNHFHFSDIAIRESERSFGNLAVLLVGFLRQLAQSARFPSSVLAFGYSPKGINLLQKMGFEVQLEATHTADQLPLLRMTVANPETLYHLAEALEEARQLRN